MIVRFAKEIWAGAFGRNGTMHVAGADVRGYKPTKDDPAGTIVVQPINSKGDVGRCRITVPGGHEGSLVAMTMLHEASPKVFEDLLTATTKIGATTNILTEDGYHAVSILRELLLTVNANVERGTSV